MKILFVMPELRPLFNNNDRTITEAPGHPHVGIAYLVSFLRQYGIEMRAFDQGLEQNNQKLYDLINNFQPDLIGITTFSYCYPFAYQTVKDLKKRFHIPIVLGGPHVSAVRKKVMNDSEVDMAINGEAEFTFLELLQELQSGNPDLGKIKGLIWRDQNGQIIENPERPYISDLDQLPFPDYEFFGFERYGHWKKKTLPIITSRGCPYRCNFCSVNLSMGRNFRARSPENVVDEMEYWAKKGVNNFEINDDVFTFNLKRAEDICNLLIERDLKITFQLYNGIRVDRVNRELITTMKKGGCNFLAFGCESGNVEVLKIIRKGLRPPMVREMVNMTHELGIETAVNFIIGHPGENYARALETIRFARSLNCSYTNFYNLVPYPGTELFKWVLENGKFLVPMENYLQDVSYRNREPIFETPDFSREERTKALMKGFALYDRKYLQFRLGHNLGTAVYAATRVEPVDKAFKVAKSKLGFRFLKFLNPIYRRDDYNLKRFKQMNDMSQPTEAGHVENEALKVAAN